MENKAARIDLVIADLEAVSEQYENLKLSTEEECKNEKSGEKRGRLYSFFFHVSYVKRTIDNLIEGLTLVKTSNLTDEEESDYLLRRRDELEKSSRIEPSDEISMAERYVVSLLDSIYKRRFGNRLPF